MAGTVVADTLQAAATSTLLIQTGNGSPVTAVSIDTSQNVKFLGAIRSNVVSTPPTIQDSAGTQIGTFCRAWVNFNGATVTNPASMTGVRASFNIASILDNGTGDYTVTFTTAMPDADYAVVCLNHQSTGNAPVTTNINTSRTSSASLVQISTTQGATRLDTTLAHFAIFR